MAGALWSGVAVAQTRAGDPEVRISELASEARTPEWAQWVEAWLAEVADCDVGDQEPVDWVPVGVRTNGDAAPALADALAGAVELDLVELERVLLLLAETSHPRTAEYLLTAYERAEELVDRALGGLMDRFAIDSFTEVDLLRTAMPEEQPDQLAVDRQRERAQLHQYRVAQVASVRRLSVLGVSKQRGTIAVEFLEQALASEDPRIRLAAARGLARQPDFPSRQTIVGLAAKEKEPYKKLLNELLYR